MYREFWAAGTWVTIWRCHMTRVLTRLAFIGIALLITASIMAQENVVEALRVETEAQDGLKLVGDYYAPAALPETGAPAILLMHDAVTSRRDWLPLTEALVEVGYPVLAVDLRGHGQTGGSSDAVAAVGDVAVWLEWLKAQPGVR